jgi:hypothetical protein
MAEKFQLYTSAFWSPKVKASVLDGSVAALGIVLYPPRKSYGYPLSGNVKELAPGHKLFKIDDKEEFWGPFRESLEKRWEVAEDRLLNVMYDNPQKDLVLLCFDRLDRPDDWCHRQVVAEFISEKWEMEVAEL